MIFRMSKKNKKQRVHRLVAEAFIPNPSRLPEINHKDENKANNCVENLEWCDHKANMESYKHNHGNFPGSIEVYCYDLDKYFASAADASVHTGINRTSIVKACRGQLQRAGGKSWCYAKDKI